MESLEIKPHISPKGIEVIRDGHVIFSFGYTGSGPVLECIEWLGVAMRGTMVRASSLDEVSAKLLVYAEVRGVECGEATWGAMAALKVAGIEIRTDRILQSSNLGALSILDSIENPKDVYLSMVRSPVLRAPGWGTWENSSNSMLLSPRRSWSH